ncbi:MAG: hydrolase [Gammaproteobacteria bacterium]|nr:hydrolase [Gammaproteobacteria bacterium]|tara:strand:- start:69702 stop:70700 length:999 start_codon:yes stop_codon:yes gene_type:complete
MDSVTQIALGAAVGEAVLGRKIGAKAALVGAICGTLPDLDSFISYGDAVASVTYHRSFSHSLLVLALISPLIAKVVTKVLNQPPDLFGKWFLLVFLVLITHPLLDTFTVYGTQLFWPFIDHPFSGSTIFIIDPAYTLPLALGVLTALFLSRQSALRVYINFAGLSLSSLYLVWTVGAKFHMEDRIKEALAEQQIEYSRLLSTPAPLNTILWRFVIMVEGGYYEAYYSILDRSHEVDFVFYPDDKALLASLYDHWPVTRLQWFTHGFYSVHASDDSLLMTDLRMGVEPNYAFVYEVAKIDELELRPVSSRSLPADFGLEQVADLWHRAMNPVR